MCWMEEALTRKFWDVHGSQGRQEPMPCETFEATLTPSLMHEEGACFFEVVSKEGGKVLWMGECRFVNGQVEVIEEVWRTP
jgi:hypothetical protein